MPTTQEKLQLYTKLKADLRAEIMKEYKTRLLGLRQYCEIADEEDKEEQLDLTSVVVKGIGLAAEIASTIDAARNQSLTVAASIRKAVEAFDKNAKFSVNDIYPSALIFNGKVEKAAVSSGLWRMTKNPNPTLEVVEPGSGKKPSIYKRL